MLGGLCSGCSLTEIHRFLAFWTFWRHGRCKERNRMFFCWSFLSVCSSGGADTPQMMLTAAVTVMRLRLTSTLCFFSFNCITPPSGWHHAARNPPDKNVHLCLCISCKSFFKKKEKKSLGQIITLLFTLSSFPENICWMRCCHSNFSI